MKRRTFIAGLGSAAAWPVMARAQQSQRMRRVGVVMASDQNDLDEKRWYSGFTQGLSELGWMDGRNIHIDVRWEGESIDRLQIFAKELVELQPDVILSTSTLATAAVQRETRTVPIVFVSVSDPVGSGFIAGYAHPGGNITGFMLEEPSMASKLLELLTEIEPGVKRAAFMFNPDTAPYAASFYLPVFEAAARTLKVAPIIGPVHNDAEIEALVASLRGEPRGGLIGASDRFIHLRRATIISLVSRYSVPAIYVHPLVKDGGLLSYGPDYFGEFHRAAAYVDRILRGAKPADLPVQLPTKFEMVVNIKTAKALGLAVPPSIMLRATEVIE